MQCGGIPPDGQTGLVSGVFSYLNTPPLNVYAPATDGGERGEGARWGWQKDVAAATRPKGSWAATAAAANGQEDVRKGAGSTGEFQRWSSES